MVRTSAEDGDFEVVSRRPVGKGLKEEIEYALCRKVDYMGPGIAPLPMPKNYLYLKAVADFLTGEGRVAQVLADGAIRGAIQSFLGASETENLPELLAAAQQLEMAIQTRVDSAGLLEKIWSSSYLTALRLLQKNLNQRMVQEAGTFVVVSSAFKK